MRPFEVTWFPNRRLLLHSCETQLELAWRVHTEIAAWCALEAKNTPIVEDVFKLIAEFSMFTMQDDVDPPAAGVHLLTGLHLLTMETPCSYSLNLKVMAPKSAHKTRQLRVHEGTYFDKTCELRAFSRIPKSRCAPAWTLATNTHPDRYPFDLMSSHVFTLHVRAKDASLEVFNDDGLSLRCAPGYRDKRANRRPKEWQLRIMPCVPGISFEICEVIHWNS